MEEGRLIREGHACRAYRASLVILKGRGGVAVKRELQAPSRPLK